MVEEIKKVIDEALSQMGLKRGMEIVEPLCCWEKVVGRRIAAHAQACRVGKDVLFVHTSSPAWAQELSLMKRELIRKINQHLGREQIQDIRFLARGIPPKVKDDASHISKHAVLITKRMMDEVDEVIKDLDDGDLREIIKKVLISDRRYKIQKESLREQGHE